MEAKATHKYITSSPRKMRLVIDLVRGESVDKAIETLHFSTKHASRAAEKVLRSAVANLFNKDEDSKHNPADLYVKEAFVNQGPTVKRMLPAPMGRAYRMRKRSNHLTIIVATKD
ncbi:MAG: 50S ribosomal protein L22 [Ignavibacteriae bacterium HGW-Ignavibacteriae-2]|jgi:large subunit ribosomal protein L22|nr:50S ribosomal protein L22 [Bacteroidota bacterium]PKL89069.1 MAG: 50S ribosomal protein L22 [Ignavibacteriae bacterium HGW-Ignavibacteriae-2]